jgi:molybdate transport system substrate-binding protein
MRLFNISLPSLFLSLGPSIEAAHLSVLSGGAIEPGLRYAAGAFEKATGHTVQITFNTAPQIRTRIEAGERFDVLVAPQKLIAEFTKAGMVKEGGLVVGRVGSGVAVRPGAPLPEIASAGDIKKTVLEADSIVFNLASTGIYFENLLKNMGVWEQVEPKTTRYATGAEVMQHALKGSGREVAFGPITEILLEKEHGLIFVGPLPPDVQNYTSYTAVPMSGSPRQDEAQALVEFLAGPEGKALFVAAGIE